MNPPEFPEVTTFSDTTTCDPTADDADLQVVQAFVAAYNQRDVERLDELEVYPHFLTDLSGIPHLGTDEWHGNIKEWAHKGWDVHDRFELTRLIRYGPTAGSTFDLVRTNDVLAANGIEILRHSGKVHSSGCSISQIVFYPPTPEGPDAPECRFYSVFADMLETGTVQEIPSYDVCRTN